jgi:hypothetical protein
MSGGQFLTRIAEAISRKTEDRYKVFGDVKLLGIMTRGFKSVVHSWQPSTSYGPLPPFSLSSDSNSKLSGREL